MQKAISIIFCLLSVTAFAGQKTKPAFTNGLCKITLSPSKNVLWAYRLGNQNSAINIEPPVFEIDGKVVKCNVERFELKEQERLSNGVKVYTATGPLANDSSFHLSIEFRLPQNNPVMRFRYILTTSGKHHFTKTNGTDHFQYLSFSLSGSSQVKEIRLSEFNAKYHANIVTENVVTDRQFADSLSLMGPVLMSAGNRYSFLLAYEHGSQFPDRFLEYQLRQNKEVSLNAVKGNYLGGQPFNANNAYETIWFEAAAIKGDEDKLAGAYRNFVLKYMSENSESRKPYIFYNTWGRQERVKWAGGTYLSSMNLETTLQEIEVAHQMGIEAYVLDVGWFQKSGDWNVNTSFFPDSLKKVKALLDKYSMKLGLWFNPLLASKSSDMLRQNQTNAVVWNGKADEPFPIWETEESVRLSLVSPYWKDYADKMIRLVKDLGVTYFKWDGISQYAANGVGHYYGTDANTQQERQESYGFQLPIYLCKIIDRVVKACPAAIFDFDITEDGRCMGLQFLSSGKYFSINNGPYFHTYNLASEWKSPLPNGNANIFVNPGAARGWFARSILGFDKWIPSVLFLTHYQPDTPRNSQLINVASLILGQNGIWGEILKTSPEGIKFIHDVLEKYKQVRNDITESSPVIVGESGLSPEIYEKINTVNGKGAVVVFADIPGRYTYVTQNKVSKTNWHNDDVTVRYDQTGRAIITMMFKESSAKILFFGTE